MVDLFAVLPWWLGLLFSSPGFTSVVRSLRLVRVLRLLRLAQTSSEMQIFTAALKRCWPAVRLLVFFLALQTLILGGLVFHLETDLDNLENGAWMQADGSRSQFQSIPAAAWWCLVTVTTVGYGDLVPDSVAGKAVAAVATTPPMPWARARPRRTRWMQVR